MSTTLADGRPVDPDDELLVAYLDGELDNEQRDEVEQRLMDEERFRTRLQTLQSSWDLLDVLPEATNNDKLVESTLELVVSDIVSKSSIQPAQIEKSRWPIVLGGLAVVSALIAFGVARLMRAQQLKQELRDIALAENLDAYLYGQDLTLMRELHADPQWTNMVSAAREVGGLPKNDSAVIADEPLNQRAAAIGALSLDDRALLETHWDRFARMSHAGRETVRKTAAAVAAQPDPELLLGTMNAYAVWLDLLPDELRDRVEKGVGDSQKQAIREAIKTTLEQVRRQSRKTLAESTTKLIYATLDHFLEQRIAEDEELAAAIELLGQQFSDPKIARRPAIRRMLGEKRFGGFGPSAPAPIESIPPLTDEELWSIIDVLSGGSDEQAAALTTLDIINSGSIMEREALVVLTLRDWAIEAFERNSPGAGPEEQKSLVDRYRELNPEIRDTLDLLPPERLKSDLDRLTKPRRFPGPFRRRTPPR